MRISGRETLVSLQLDETGKKVLSDADVEPERALAAFIIDEDEHGLWMRIDRTGGRYWLLIRWPWILSVEIPALLPKTQGPPKIRGI
jgi:hypothetical protein